MPGEFRMPSLGADMDAGTLVEWLKHPGDTVRRGDVIAVVETQKGAIEVEVFESGELRQLLVEEGTRVPVGTVMALIGDGEVPQTALIETATPETMTPAVPAAAPAPAAGRRRISPLARRTAAELGVDLDGLTGSGPEGAVQRADVLAAAAGAGARRRPGLDLAEMRKAIAAAMARSKREIPHYYLAHSFDLSPASAWLDARNAQRVPSERLLMGALLVKATVLALRAYPEFNGFCEDGAFRPSEAVHLGVAVAIRGGGLIAPAIHDCDDLALDEVMARMRDLVARVRGGTLRSSELSDPTATLSSLGDRGVERLYGVIYPPQVALIGFGRPTLRAWADEAGVAAKPVVTVTLAADHRVSDGHRGALLLARIERLLEQPETL